MTREKKSFFEKLTGTRTLDGMDAGSSMPIYTEEDETAMHMSHAPAQDEATAQEWSTSEVAQNNDAEGQLTIDVYQTDGDIVIKSTIAGVKPEDLDVAINNDMVTIKGDRKQEDTVEGENYYYQECYWGSFSRSVVLPVDVVVEKAEASLKNGILTIRLPKAQTNKTKKIQVRGF